MTNINLIEQLEERISGHRRAIMEAVANIKNYTGGFFRSRQEEEAFLRLARINGYLKLFLEKLKCKEKVSSEDISLLYKFELVYNELIKEFSLYRAVS